MKIEEVNISQERTIVTMMIVSTPFLNQIAPIIKVKLFKSSYAKTVITWIMEYWNEFKQAPGKNIQNIYQNKITKLRNEEDTEIISEFLKRLSKDYENQSEVHNIDYIIKESIKYLKLSSLELLKEELEIAIDQADPVEGEKKVASYYRIEKPTGEGIRLLRDSKEIKKAFTDKDEVLFKFDGALGEVCGEFLRGDLISFLAAAKRGKSWYQWVLSYLAMQSGLQVLFFSLEMTENQIYRRAWQSLVGQPRTDMEIEVPYFEQIGMGKRQVDDRQIRWRINKRKERKKGVNTDEIEDKQKKFRFYHRGGEVWIKVVPADSVSIEDIETEMDNMNYYDNYLPDIVVIDYADILKPSSITYKNEYRHQLDHTWKTMRRIAQDRNILVVTASQTSRAGFSQDANESILAEDVRKINHVSKMIAINQTKKDRINGMVRIEQLAERDGRRCLKQAVVLQCLEIGRPYLDSRFADEVEGIEKK